MSIFNNSYKHSKSSFWITDIYIYIYIIILYNSVAVLLPLIYYYIYMFYIFKPILICLVQVLILIVNLIGKQTSQGTVTEEIGNLSNFLKLEV